MAYAFKAIFTNEMSGLEFPCTGVGAVPFGPGYTNDTYKSCSIPGQKPV